MNLPKIPVPPLKTNGRVFLESLLNKNVKIEITDGRTLIGQYLCTDRDKNIVLGGCQEFVTDPGKNSLTVKIMTNLKGISKIFLYAGESQTTVHLQNPFNLLTFL